MTNKKVLKEKNGLLVERNEDLDIDELNKRINEKMEVMKKARTVVGTISKKITEAVEVCSHISQYGNRLEDTFKKLS